MTMFVAHMVQGCSYGPTEESRLLLFSRLNVSRDEHRTLTTILELSRNVRTRQHTENIALTLVWNSGLIKLTRWL
jgi:hypothetical protein